MHGGIEMDLQWFEPEGAAQEPWTISVLREMLLVMASNTQRPESPIVTNEETTRNTLKHRLLRMPTNT